MENSSLDDLVALVASGKAQSQTQYHVEIVTPSGRKFRYELTDYPVSASTTPEQALTQAKLIFREKYRYCEWDRNHPYVDVEREIIAKLVHNILKVAEKIRQWETRKPRQFAFWAIVLNDQVVEEYPFRDKGEAERRRAELIAQTGNKYELKQIKRDQRVDE
jgi:hypothetical protein